MRLVLFPYSQFSFFVWQRSFRSTCGVCISQLVRVARICNNVSDFNDRYLMKTGEKMFTPRILFS